MLNPLPLLIKEDNNAKNDTTMTVKSSVLGDVIKNINIPNDPSDITVLGDAIWAGTLNDPKLYKININTGAEIAHYEVGFAVYGLTTDGTYLYASVKEVGNGTIFKLDTTGNIISTFEIEVDNFFHGLAYDGNSLWAYHHSRNLLKINPDTGVVLANYTNDNSIAGLTYFKGYVWGIAYNKDEIHAFDPDTGRVQEVFHHSLSGFGEFGLAQDGTHFLISFFHNDSISFLEYPTEIGEVFNIYDPSIDHPLGMDWNGTHFFVADRITDTVHIYHDGTFELIDTIALGYDPIGLVIVGNYLYVASYESPYNIYKYSFNGSLIATFNTGIHCYDLAYDGNYIYLTRYSDAKISKLDPTDCTLIETYAVEEEYAGLTYDSLNNVFWGVGWGSNKIYQLDTTVFNKTGIQYDTPTTLGEYGLCFDEDHLIMNSWGTDKFYKIIIDIKTQKESPSTGIPGYNMLIFVSIFIGFGILLFQIKKRHRKVYEE